MNHRLQQQSAAHDSLDKLMLEIREHIQHEIARNVPATLTAKASLPEARAPPPDFLPATGYLRLSQIIGQREVTEVQAAANRRRGRGPRRPRPAIPPLIPVSKSSWWAGVKTRRYPQPVRTLGVRITAWRAEAIMALISNPASPRAA
jgi:prophage regulatory protein